MGDTYDRRRLKRLTKEVKAVHAEEKIFESGTKLAEKLKIVKAELAATKASKTQKSKGSPKIQKKPLSTGS